MDLTRPRRIHVVGAGGAAMSAIATVLAAMGHRVTGSDIQESAALERLRASGISVFLGHAAEHVGDAELVTISTAVRDTNPEVVEARRRSVPVVSRAHAQAAIAARRRTVAIAGTKGKTTTTSMLTAILTEAGLRPSYIIGGDISGGGQSAAWTDGEWFVVEADESDGTFLELGAEAVVVTNVEPDHLAHYGTFEALVGAFGDFLEAAPGPRIVCADDASARSLALRVGATTYGTSADADWKMTDVRGGRDFVSFQVATEGIDVATVRLPLPGVHNARNACAALAMGVALGAPVEAAVRALGSYRGVVRRYQFRGEAGGVTFVDDYAHLPTALINVLATARQGGWRRVVAVFQPHRYTRTASLAGTFGDAFVDADLLVVSDVYPAGENPLPGVTGKLIVDAVLDRHPTARVAWLPDRASVVAYLAPRLRPGDLCLTLGAGDVTLWSDDISAAVAARGAAPGSSL